MSNGIYDYVNDVKERLAEKDKRISELEEQLKNATKQVRKEVCERLDKIIEKYLCKKDRYRESLDISSIIKQVMKENLAN